MCACTIVCCGRFGTWSITESLMTDVICSVQYCWLISYMYLADCTGWVKSNANTLTPVHCMLRCSLRINYDPLWFFYWSQCIVLLWSILVSSRRRFTYVVVLRVICWILLLSSLVITRLVTKWNKLRCLCMKCYVSEKEFLNFQSNFQSRSQVDYIISCLACEWLYATDCTLHTTRLPSVLYCVRWLYFATIVVHSARFSITIL